MERIFCNDHLIREVAQELGLSVEVVKNMVATQSEYTRIVMESNTFDFIRWPYLGIFRSKPKEIQMLQYLQGMTPDQAAEFKKAVRTGKIRLDAWKDKANDKSKTQLQRSVGSNRDIQDDTVPAGERQGG